MCQQKPTKLTELWKTQIRSAVSIANPNPQPLCKCRGFRAMHLDERKKVLKDKALYFLCCALTVHQAMTCPTALRPRSIRNTWSQLQTKYHLWMPTLKYFSCLEEIICGFTRCTGSWMVPTIHPTHKSCHSDAPWTRNQTWKLSMLSSCRNSLITTMQSRHHPCKKAKNADICQCLVWVRYFCPDLIWIIAC